MTADTILHRLHENGRIRPNAPAYYVKTGDAWVPTPWHEYVAEVRQAARALLSLGMKPGDTATILGFNRPEWVVFDLAAMLTGGAAAGIYTTNSPHEVKYIVEHAECEVMLIENEHQWEKIKQVRDDLANLKHVVTMKGTKIDDPMVLSWDEFMAKGNAVDESKVDECLDALEVDQLCTMIYTSGTTGPPKAVMLSHTNLAWTAKQAQGLLSLTSKDSVLSYLPLSHIAEQMFTVHAAITAGYRVYYAQYPPQQFLNSNFQEVQPTMVFGVPRIWERIQSGVASAMAEATGAKKAIANWATGVGAQVTELKNKGLEPSGLLAMQYNLANKLVLSKVKERLGFAKTKHFISGAAPLSKDVMDFLGKLDISIFEIYGQSEGTGPTTTNRPGAVKFGTVGQAWPGSQVKLAPDGEILLKGKNVFMGYYKNEAATNETVIDGWLQSGDLGQFDEDGFLSIVGRKKEIIITSGGKNIAPKNIEAALKNLDLIAEAVVIGEQRRFLSALLTLDEEFAPKFAAEHGLEGQSLHDNPKVIEHVQKEIDEKVNSLFARVEHVRAFTILPRNFSVEDGELTPTLKIKRRIINENFADEIEAMYAK